MTCGASKPVAKRILLFLTFPRPNSILMARAISLPTGLAMYVINGIVIIFVTEFPTGTNEKPYRALDGLRLFDLHWSKVQWFTP
jgi:hypothetical protein